VVKATLRLLFPWEREPAPIAKEAESAPEPVWTPEENLVPLGFDPRTVKPLASNYRNYAVPAHLYLSISLCKLEKVRIVSRGKTESDVKYEFLLL
jgi:hypothetical protein